MSTRAGIAADAAAALLFRILSQPALLFPPLRHVEGVEVQHKPMDGYISSYKKQLGAPAAEAIIDATAQGIASMLCAHGPEVEWRICTIWEAAYGLLPLSSSVDLPELVVASPLQPPALSWSLYLPLLKVLEYLPRGSPSEACLIRIFVATVEAILRRTFPPEASIEQSKKSGYGGGMWSTTKSLAVAELHTMIHSLFLDSCASMDRASRLLFVLLTVCVSHEALLNGSKGSAATKIPVDDITEELPVANRRMDTRNRVQKKQGPVATFDSYVLAAICGLACELQLFPLMLEKGTHSDSSDSPKIAKIAKIIGGFNETRNGLGLAVRHTLRILGILEALFSLKPSLVGSSWSYTSNEIVAAAMVAAHVSELFGRSKACMNALSVLKRSKWDIEISSRAASLYHLIDLHGRTVASILHKAEPLQANLVGAYLGKDKNPVLFSTVKQSDSSSSCVDPKKTSFSKFVDPISTEIFLECDKVMSTNDAVKSQSRKTLATLPVDALDLANFLTTDQNLGYDCSAQSLLRSVLDEKQELCFSVVSLLWHKLIAAPEAQVSAEGTSAQQGWRQVVVALCDVVSASPSKASTAIVLQAERDLQPWIARDEDQDQKMWRSNKRIVKLIVELIRNHDNPEALIILASTSDLLLRATDGMLVDGEACTLPQLELLEVTARAVHLMVDWGETGVAVADGLSELLKCRLSATVRCLSHSSVLVRSLSTSVLRDLMHSCVTKTTSSMCGDRWGIGLGVGASFNWYADIEKCIRWEARSRRATGLSLAYLLLAAKELGCPLSC